MLHTRKEHLTSSNTSIRAPMGNTWTHTRNFFNFWRRSAAAFKVSTSLQNANLA